MADHPGAATYIALGHGSIFGRINGFKNMGFIDMKSIDIIQPAIPGFSHDRQAKTFAFMDGHIVFDQGFTDDTNLVGISQGNRRAQHARFFQPQQASHFAVAIERMISGKGVIFAAEIGARQNYRHTGTRYARLVID